ncbi:hypothetical protein AKJ37_00465 [candidate division MSBL1 archaeon SCGC-AAA259I09]|uniref:RCK N-terminal domain-containing protein n=3 Tax=candidate division MSBL1 TaxID=215777 RepID=A0A133UVT8_9EURY|nr:hypothetical protein AKJ66_02400 [candidate division MSBL1 archaeon SCGC-AAA259E22]KXA98299.1 hypothetical protein AKJ37_00465 [candidate division MSBL1 archaeon SCGC-AAA259I09]KXA99738.1 hypothetical protein AKJ40_02495 [candidate division MSBL1 archaeon SCGC-AAA259M10]
MYLLFGCGDVGFALAQKLQEGDREVQIIEKDEGKVRQLRDMEFEVVQGDFTDTEDIGKSDIKEAEVILILASDLETVKRALGGINQLKLDLEIDPIVVARATDSILKSEIKELGADEVVVISEVFAEQVHDRFQEFRERIKEKKLRKLLNGLDGKLAIVLQDNPDPDSISSGMGLRIYAEPLGVESDLIYSGRIGHQQNRALVNTLNSEMLRAEDIDFEDYGAYALVDVSTHGNCSLPEDIDPDIIIDHHSATSSRAEADFEDIINVGSTATIVTNYLRYAEREIDEQLATALTFAILTDTMNFTRGATHLDFSTLEFLLPLISKELLQEFQSPPLSADTLEVIRKAIRSSRVKGGYLIANVGEVKDRDAIAQAADYLLRREGTLTTLIYGIESDAVYMSGRTKDVRLHIGKTMEELYGDIGSAGGHPTAGGGKIPIDAFDVSKDNKKALRGAMDRNIGRKFWAAFGALKSER